MDDKKQSEEMFKLQDNSLSSRVTISVLNDDCLRYILSYLPFKDKIILQRVSKRWQLLMPWNTWNGEKNLDIAKSGLGLGDEDLMYYSLSSLKKILGLCGIYIISIDVHALELENKLEEILELLKKSCSNLKSLDLCICLLTKPSIQFLTQNFDHLTSLGFSKCADGCENEIYELFLKLKNLRSIKIVCSNIKGKCLTGLHLESIEEFNIDYSGDLILTHLCEVFKKMDNLRILQVVDQIEAIENIDKLLKNLPNRSKLEELTLELSLNKLTINFGNSHKKLVQMKNLCYFTNLQKLDLTGSQVVHDEALTIIGNNCEKLKVACISDSNILTDAGWQNFAKLTNIEELEVEDLSAITYKWPLYLQSSMLRRLVCWKIDLTNESLKFVLKLAKKLEILDVALCPKVDYNTLVMDASAQIESRPKCESLKLQIDMKKIHHKVENISARLSIARTTCPFVDPCKEQQELQLKKDALAQQFYHLYQLINRERN